MKIKVLSLFDGISVAQQALKELGYDVEYYASEIDKYAIQITQKNHPDTIPMGDVRGIKGNNGLIILEDELRRVFTEIDLLIGGSPCQDLSIAKKNRQGLDGARSGLFWEYVRILKEVKPKYFVLENVNSMPKEAKAIITEALGVEPIMINASLVSAQNRKRLFWTNIPNVTQPEDKGILLKDILEKGVDEKYTVPPTTKTKWIDKGLSKDGKAKAMSASLHKGIGTDGLTLVRIGQTAKQGYQVVDEPNDIIRKLTPIECERLQSLPDNYTEGISNSQRYKCLGNAFNKEVVKHILSFMK
jgi:DNA-cytosine methyltransferase